MTKNLPETEDELEERERPSRRTAISVFLGGSLTFSIEILVFFVSLLATVVCDPLSMSLDRFVKIFSVPGCSMKHQS